MHFILKQSSAGETGQEKLCAARFDLWNVLAPDWDAVRLGDTWAPSRMGTEEESSKEPDELGVFVMNVFGVFPGAEFGCYI